MGKIWFVSHLHHRFDQRTVPPFAIRRLPPRLASALRLLLLFISSQCGTWGESAAGTKHLRSPDFPGVRWGFSTVSFLPHVPVTVESSTAHIDLAKRLGFTWIELRDPDARLTPEECGEIAAHARRVRIQVNYSAQRGLLAGDFHEVFARAAKNTALFDGPRVIRVLALRGTGDKGWSDAELARMVEVANEAAQRAARLGMQLAVENADGALDSRDRRYQGMAEFFDGTSPDVLLQLDTANFFTSPAKTTPKRAAEFISAMADRTAYVHLKSARNGKPLPKLDGNPLGFREILGILCQHGAPAVALELAPAPTAADVNRHIAESIDALIAEGILECVASSDQR